MIYKPNHKIMLMKMEGEIVELLWDRSLSNFKVNGHTDYFDFRGHLKELHS